MRLHPPARVWRSFRDSILRPAHVLEEWSSGRRDRLTSPVKLISWLVFLSWLAGQIISFLYGVSPGAGPSGSSSEERMRRILDSVSWMERPFGDHFRGNGSNFLHLTDNFETIASTVIAFWPSYFVFAGFLALAPWKRLSRTHSLLVAAIETIFILFAGTIAYVMVAIASGGSPSELKFQFAGLWFAAVLLHTGWFLRPFGYGYGRITAIAVLSILYWLLLMALMLGLALALALGWTWVRTS